MPLNHRRDGSVAFAIPWKILIRTFMNRNTLLCKLCVASVAERQMRRFVAMFPEDELTLNLLETAAHRRFVSEVRRNFDVTALHLQKGLVYLKRIFSATKTNL